MYFPPKKPTPAEYVVLIVFISAVLVIVGLAAIIIGLRAPPEKHELALVLEHRGIWCLCIGIGVGFTFWALRRIVDYF